MLSNPKFCQTNNSYRRHEFRLNLSTTSCVIFTHTDTQTDRSRHITFSAVESKKKMFIVLITDVIPKYSKWTTRTLFKGSRCPGYGCRWSRTYSTTKQQEQLQFLVYYLCTWLFVLRTCSWFKRFVWSTLYPVYVVSLADCTLCVVFVGLHM